MRAVSLASLMGLMACGVDVATPSLLADAATGLEGATPGDTGASTPPVASDASALPSDRPDGGAWRAEAGPVNGRADAASPPREDDHANRMELGTNVPLNSQTAGVINYEEDIDFFVFRTAGRGEYRIATEGRVDTFCALYTADGRPLYSNDNSGSRQNCEILERLNAQTEHAVSVRHFDPDSRGGRYQLVIEGPLSDREPICGNTLIEEGEQCDDGNRRNGDGCDADCQREQATVTLPRGCQAVETRPRRTALCWQPRARQAAADHCETAGMTLVTIDDERDNAILFQASNRTSPWIGLSDQREEDLWVWDSRTSGYVNWNRGEPNDWNGNEDCVQMTTSGRWNDVNCGSRLMFFCEDPR